MPDTTQQTASAAGPRATTRETDLEETGRGTAWRRNPARRFRIGTSPDHMGTVTREEWIATETRLGLRGPAMALPDEQDVPACTCFVTKTLRGLVD